MVTSQTGLLVNIEENEQDFLINVFDFALQRNDVIRAPTQDENLNKHISSTIRGGTMLFLCHYISSGTELFF